eukprot:CAMPEP_0183731104 /NCGR_PEP_ID=MMETSP0737-20130205/34450_1 /TAXON_ID=385413 /ORGANISM="Thalassiosira miniscula, Strain CCMP1093" /LENGTH=63 /DNA_ID=CAMNT_0025963763 /DNA_START=1 /DNA_END=189 /DNA_ORIENTATION=+
METIHHLLRLFAARRIRDRIRDLAWGRLASDCCRNNANSDNNDGASSRGGKRQQNHHEDSFYS